MSQPKLHHYVSQAQLKYFSFDGVSVYRYDKQTKLAKPLPIPVIAAEKNLYTFETIDGKMDTTVENPFFSNIDGSFNNIIDHIRKQKPLIEIQDKLVYAISTSYARAPKQLKNFQRVADELYKFITPIFKEETLKDIEAIAQEFEKDTGKKMSEEQKRWIIEELPKIELRASKGQALNGMFAAMEVHGQIMQKSYFWIGIAPKGKYFIISDNPAEGGYIPLSSGICLFSSNTRPNREYEIMTPEGVDEINQITYEESERYIFSENLFLPENKSN